MLLNLYCIGNVELNFTIKFDALDVLPNFFKSNIDDLFTTDIKYNFKISLLQVVLILS